eukprot:c14817_g1_i3.p1 GENE.c14817_g1_i3~~c14817_g1_i3.p1  ORF type:complete len:324 (+),score=44.33 c14817_g1_i3:555-1526(+)
MLVGPLPYLGIEPQDSFIRRALTTRLTRGVYYNFVDVRDAAAAHISALTLPFALNRRFFLASNWGFPVSNETVAELFRTIFAKMGHKMCSGFVPYSVLGLRAMFRKPQAILDKERLGKRWLVDISLSDPVFGTFRPVHESLIEMGYSAFEQNLVKRPPQYERSQRSLVDVRMAQPQAQPPQRQVNIPLVIREKHPSTPSNHFEEQPARLVPPSLETRVEPNDDDDDDDAQSDQDTRPQVELRARIPSLAKQQSFTSTGSHNEGYRVPSLNLAQVTSNVDAVDDVGNELDDLEKTLDREVQQAASARLSARVRTPRKGDTSQNP